MIQEEIINREIAERLIKIKGEARGIHFRNDAEYVLTKKGEEGLKAVEEELERLGFPIKYGEMKNLAFYPAGLRIVSLLAIKKALNLNNDGVREMCAFATRASFVVKLYLKFFYSIPKILEKASALWKEYWNHGRLVIQEHNEEKGYVILKIDDFDLDPTYCRCLEGYIENLARMVSKSEKVVCRETKCSFKEGRGHEFFIQYK